MSDLIQNVQIKIKESGAGFFTFVFRLFTGSVLGLTFAIAGEEIFKYGAFSFWFVFVCILGVFLKVSQDWTAGALVVFNLLCILVGFLLRMYVVVAPGA